MRWLSSMVTGYFQLKPSHARLELLLDHAARKAAVHLHLAPGGVPDPVRKECQSTLRGSFPIVCQSCLHNNSGDRFELRFGTTR